MKVFFVALIALSVQTFIAERSLVKIDVVSKGIVQLIDYLSVKYHMRFTIVIVTASIESTDHWAKDLAQNVMKHSTSSFIVKYSENNSQLNLIDFDDSYLIFHDLDERVLPEYLQEANYLTFHKKMTLSFNVMRRDSFIEKMVEFVDRMYDAPYSHDVYQLAHSPENGSMWLISNEMFHNKTCNSFYHPINFFNSSSMQWSSSKFFNQYKSFYNCEVNMGTQDLLNNRFVHREIDKKHNEFLSSILAVFMRKHQITFKNATGIVDLLYKEAYYKTHNEIGPAIAELKEFGR